MGNEGQNVNKLQKKGSEMEENQTTVSVSRLRFTQDSIAVQFSSGQRIDDTVKELLSGSLLPEAFPRLLVFPYNGHLWCFSNRRLWVFRQAKVATARVVMASVHYQSRLYKLMSNETTLTRDLAKPDYLPRVRGSVNLDLMLHSHGHNKFIIDGGDYKNVNRFEEASSPTVSLSEGKDYGAKSAAAGVWEGQRTIIAPPISHSPQTNGGSETIIIRPGEEQVSPPCIRRFLGRIRVLLQWIGHTIMALCHLFFTLRLGCFLLPQTLPLFCYWFQRQLMDNWLLHQIVDVSDWLLATIVGFWLLLAIGLLGCWLLHQIMKVGYWLLYHTVMVIYGILWLLYHIVMVIYGILW